MRVQTWCRGREGSWSSSPFLSLKKPLASSHHTSCEIQVHRDARFPSSSCGCPSRLPSRTPSCEFSRTGCLAGSRIMTVSDDNRPLSGTGVSAFPSSHELYALATAEQDLAASYARFRSALSCVVSLASHTVKKRDDVCIQAGEVGSEWATTCLIQ